MLPVTICLHSPFSPEEPPLPPIPHPPYRGLAHVKQTAYDVVGKLFYTGAPSK